MVLTRLSQLLCAEPHMRRSTVAIVVASAAFGGIALWAMRRWLDGMSQPSPASKPQLLTAFVWLIGVTVLLLVALGAYLFHYGRRVLRSITLPASRSQACSRYAGPSWSRCVAAWPASWSKRRGRRFFSSAAPVACRAHASSRFA